MECDRRNCRNLFHWASYTPIEVLISVKLAIFGNNNYKYTKNSIFTMNKKYYSCLNILLKAYVVKNTIY